MRNAVFPPFYSQICGFGGNSEVQNLQMPNANFSTHLNSGLNVYGNFLNHLQTSNDHHLGEGFALLPTPEIHLQKLNYPLGFLTMNSSLEEDSQPSTFPEKRFAVSQSQTGVADSVEIVEYHLQPTPACQAAVIGCRGYVFLMCCWFMINSGCPNIRQLGFRTIENTRKRSIEVDNQIENEMATKELKKQKVVSTEEQPNYRGINDAASDYIQEQRVPVRRSQKIGDRITTLQKLVSPFGKTDTASVLQEASVYIKLLQEQIQMLSTPYFRIGPLHPQTFGEGQADLRSRGLCLVPVSFTQKLTKDDRVDNAISRRTIIP